jgi:hypothetical protein
MFAVTNSNAYVTNCFKTVLYMLDTLFNLSGKIKSNTILELMSFSLLVICNNTQRISRSGLYLSWIVAKVSVTAGDGGVLLRCLPRCVGPNFYPYTSTLLLVRVSQNKIKLTSFFQCFKSTNDLLNAFDLQSDSTNGTLTPTDVHRLSPALASVKFNDGCHKSKGRATWKSI